MTKAGDIHRRQFIRSTVAGAIGAAVNAPLGQRAFGRSSRERPPNILLIMSDEHDSRISGCYGNPIARTPHIDHLAQTGVIFDNAYCNSPLCSPSRLSFTSGKYIHRVRAWNNAAQLPSEDIASLATVMQAANFNPFLCGKMHYDFHRRYGFVDIGPLRSNGWIKEGGGSRRNPDNLKPKKMSHRFYDFGTGEDSRVLSHDREVTKSALSFLAQRKRVESPFFMIVGYLAPHFPLIVPDKNWRHFRDQVPMPQIPDGFIDSMPLNYQLLRAGMGLQNVDDLTTKLGRELYYGLTEWIDNEIGKVLAALQKSDVNDDTIIIYTSDHGENLGEHGLWWKKTMYEQSARVPLIVSWPKRWAGGQRRRKACSLLDLVQTIVELGGGTTPEDWDGDSMVDWLDNHEKSWKDLAVSQYYGQSVASGYTMLRQGQYKYVYHTPPSAQHAAQRELYDLQHDPMEFNNLADMDPYQARVDQMHTLMVKEVGESPEITEQRCRVDFSRNYHQDQKVSKAGKSISG